MNREDIIRMAREAGFVDYELDDYTPSGYDIRYERFASLVAAAAKAEEREKVRSSMKKAFRRMAGLIRADEREACAKVCEDLFASTGRTFDHRALAAAIRARGQA